MPVAMRPQSRLADQSRLEVGVPRRYQRRQLVLPVALSEVVGQAGTLRQLRVQGGHRIRRGDHLAARHQDVGVALCRAVARAGLMQRSEHATGPVRVQPVCWWFP